MITIDFSDHEHWVNKYYWARGEMLSYKRVMEEALEEILTLAGPAYANNEATLLVHGKPVLHRVPIKQTTFTISDVRKQFPEVAAKLDSEKTIWQNKPVKD
jgi:hypothetical protein